MGKNISIQKMDYTIKDWINKSKIYDPQLPLERLSKMSKKKKHKEARLMMDENGRIVISQRKKKYIDLELYYDNPDKYYNDLYFFIYSIKDCIEDEYCRENFISFIFPSKSKDKTIYQLSPIHFVYNMIIWLPFFILNIPISKNKIFMPEHFTNSSYVNYVNNEIIEPYKHLTTLNEMSKMLAKMYDLFQRISDLYGLRLGISFSMYDIISQWDNPELYEISHTKIPSKFQIAEMEEFATKKTKRFTEIWLNDMDNNPNDSLKTMIRAKQMNVKQLREFVVTSGTKPDLSGDTYSHIPKPGTNLVANGLRVMVDYVNDSNGGRKSTVLALNIDEGGYIARAFAKSCSDIKLCEDPNFDCGSENYYTCTITDKNVLKNMRGRWYLNKETNTYRQLIETDYDMIGKTLDFRSPTTCAGGERGICHTCYGHLASQNTNIHIGISSALKLSESNYQLMMSAKHMLDTQTNLVKFNDEFDDFFTLEDGFRIILRSDIDEIESYELWLNIYSTFNDDDNNYNEYVDDFIIYDKEKKQKIIIGDENKCEIYLCKQLQKIFDERRKERDYNAKGYVKINLSDFSTDKDIFFLRLKNKELTKPLRELKLLIEKGGDIGISTVSELIDKVKYLMECGGIQTETIHIEILCRNLIRDKYNKIKLPDWSKKNPEYMITSIHNSIFWSSSITNSITFEKIKIQLKDPLTYKKRNTSFLDPCFILDYDKK